jgi:hypothetical protein
MKAFALPATVLATVFYSQAAAVTLENVSLRFSTNTQIIWLAPTNNLQRSFWIYKKMPRVFSANTISNAVVLASLQSKGFPQPSTKPIVIWADRQDGEPDPPYFEITPDWGEFSYSLGDRGPDSAAEYFKDAATVERAWDSLEQLGIDRREFVKTNIASYGEYGVFLPRQIDGIRVYDESEGFSFQQFGSPKRIRHFWLSLPNLERTQKSPTASTQEIVACIQNTVAAKWIRA